MKLPEFKRQIIAHFYDEHIRDLEVLLSRRTSKALLRELEPIELYSISQIIPIYDLIQEELQLLREQFADDKEVRYLLEVIGIEGIVYTLCYKLDAGDYVGSRSTLGMLSTHLKIVSRCLDKIGNQLDKEEHDRAN